MLPSSWGIRHPKGDLRVEDVEHSVDDVGDEVDVALSSSSSRVHAERLFSSKAEEQQFGVVDVELVRRLPLARALLQICVVPVRRREIPLEMIYWERHRGRFKQSTVPTGGFGT